MATTYQELRDRAGDVLRSVLDRPASQTTADEALTLIIALRLFGCSESTFGQAVSGGTVAALLNRGQR